MAGGGVEDQAGQLLLGPGLAVEPVLFVGQEEGQAVAIDLDHGGGIEQGPSCAVQDALGGLGAAGQAVVVEEGDDSGWV